MVDPSVLCWLLSNGITKTNLLNTTPYPCSSSLAASHVSVIEPPRRFLMQQSIHVYMEVVAGKSGVLSTLTSV